MWTNHRIPSQLQSSYLSLFASEHLEPGRFDELLGDMLVGKDQAPADAVSSIARAVATWGTARPFTAVVTLVAWTGHHWRTIRGSLTDKGIADPLALLPSLHSLLDVTEQLVLQAVDGDGKPAVAKREREKILDMLYRPEPSTTSTQKTVRPFTDDETEESFDHFMKAI